MASAAAAMREFGGEGRNPKRSPVHLWGGMKAWGASIAPAAAATTEVLRLSSRPPPPDTPDCSSGREAGPGETEPGAKPAPGRGGAGWRRIEPMPAPHGETDGPLKGEQVGAPPGEAARTLSGEDSATATEPRRSTELLLTSARVNSPPMELGGLCWNSGCLTRAAIAASLVGVGGADHC